MIDYFIETQNNFGHIKNSAERIEEINRHYDILKEKALSEISKRLLSLRTMGNLTQEEASELIGVGRNTIHNWEDSTKRKSLPNTFQLLKLSCLYGVSPSYILCAIDEKTDTEKLIREDTGLTEESIRKLSELFKDSKAYFHLIDHHIQDIRMMFFLNYLICNSSDLYDALNIFTELSMRENRLNNDPEKESIIKLHDNLMKNYNGRIDYCNDTDLNAIKNYIRESRVKTTKDIKSKSLRKKEEKTTEDLLFYLDVITSDRLNAARIGLYAAMINLVKNYTASLNDQWDTYYDYIKEQSKAET